MTQISAGPQTRLVIAPFGIRLGAFIVDWSILSALAFTISLLGWVIPGSVMSAAATALGIIWPLAWLRSRSATPGKLMTGLRVQPAAGPGRLTWSQILVRVAVKSAVPAIVVWLVTATTDASSTGLFASFMVLAGFLWILIDDISALGHPLRQTLHDRAAGTVVVKKITQWAAFPAPVPGGAPPNTAPPASPAPGP